MAQPFTHKPLKNKVHAHLMFYCVFSKQLRKCDIGLVCVRVCVGGGVHTVFICVWASVRVCMCTMCIFVCAYVCAGVFECLMRLVQHPHANIAVHASFEFPFVHRRLVHDPFCGIFIVDS